MNIYLIYQDTNRGYDTYDSAVVIAESEEEARNIHPGEYDKWDYHSWASPVDVQVKKIGKALKSETKGVVCASFNAG